MESAVSGSRFLPGPTSLIWKSERDLGLQLGLRKCCEELVLFTRRGLSLCGALFSSGWTPLVPDRYFHSGQELSLT